MTDFVLRPGSTEREIRAVWGEARPGDTIIVMPTSKERFMKKRSHKNNKRRLTAKERAKELVDAFLADASLSYDEQVMLATRHLQAHARATLRRDDRRDRK